MTISKSVERVFEIFLPMLLFGSGVLFGCGTEVVDGVEPEMDRKFQSIGFSETVNGRFLCGLTTSNEVVCWGPEIGSEGKRMDSLDRDITKLLVIGEELCTRDANGRIYCVNLKKDPSDVKREVRHTKSMYKTEDRETLCYKKIHERRGIICRNGSSRKYVVGQEFVATNEMVCGVGSPDQIGVENEKGKVESLNWNDGFRPSMECKKSCVKCVERHQDLMLGDGFVVDANVEKVALAGETLCRVGANAELVCLVLDLGYNQYPNSSPSVEVLTRRREVGLWTPTVGDVRLETHFRSAVFDEVAQLKAGKAGVCLKPRGGNFRCWNGRGKSYDKVNKANLKTVSVGSNTLCGLTPKQRIRCFGQFYRPNIPEEFIAGERR